MNLAQLAPLVDLHVEMLARVVLGRARVSSAKKVLRGKCEEAFRPGFPGLWSKLRKAALRCLEGASEAPVSKGDSPTA